MSRSSVRMGVAEGLALVGISTFAGAFLSIWSIMQDRANSAAWMIPPITFAVSLAALYMLLYVLRRTGGDLYDAARKLLGPAAARLIAFIYAALFFLDAGLMLREFAENTLLTALPHIDFEVIIGWYAVVVVFMLYFGIEAVARTGYIILPFSIFGISVILLLLWPEYQFLYLAPWNGSGLDKVLITGIKSTGFNLGMMLPVILATSFQNASTIRGATIYGLGLAEFYRTITVVAYTATFGTAVAREKVLPFFELARLVYINRFIQRIEALFILVWVIVGMLAIAIDVYAGLYLLGRIFNLPDLRPLIGPAVIVILEMAMLPPDVVTVIAFHGIAINSYYFTGAAIFPAVLFLIALVKARRREEWHAA